jgi:predicted alpha-1,2-mannosidase
MIGYHAFPVIAEAYRKGFRDWDAKLALELMKKNSTSNDWWAEKGYMPADKQEQSVSKTAEFAYDDWALSQFAKDRGDSETAKKFAHRAQAYKNIYDKKSGFARGRLADGSWRTPFDPDDTKPVGHDFTEGNAWQYTFFAPQDIPGLITEMGGREQFIKKLDEMFEHHATDKKQSLQDFTGLIGQYAQGNEPSHHIAYLYSYAGVPAKTQERVRQIRDQLYTSSRDGLCGNEDCGQMSAWYVLSALGFYPVNTVNGEYVLGVPAFAEATIKLPKGKKFTITADPKKKFVDKVLLNGNLLSRTYITHADITNGGTLNFIMTDADKPSSKWGTKLADAPH